MITKEYLQQELAKRIDGYKRGVETTTDNIIAEMKSILVLVDALPDYEKKYNEALKRAKAAVDVAADKELVKGVATTIFPELRESEDERITRAINNMLPFIPDKAYANNGVTKEGVLNWLEKQKEQKPAEWSEEDEVLRQDCIRFIETGWTDNGKSHLIPWLKSLRPSWKPSEEQMEGLKFFLEFHRSQRNAGTVNWREYDAIESLYEDLKKL